ncbi:FadR/GntR family transcriptional regulator [Blastococcus sp. PRF04-17]|uniref:FadR/GntR family transcriptional regulator n=1 Tax=Blastococcus sp. PRF04-17 TaxID=2933797 RepID=UPI001FF6CE97|nr:FCD domain-containing protein [Blastococcus sp. PRF04-17]UOY03616.1 FCD domain-containing protein [Blastococcus sp. PRF04-17]
MSTPADARPTGPRPRTIRRGAKVAEALALEIVNRIVSENLRPGTLLPPEAQMVEEYGVGRSSLREALHVLEVHGVITMKHGRNGGPMVIEVGTRDYGRMSTLFFHLRGITFAELIDARLVLEPVMARLAAQRRATELIGTLPDPTSTEVADDAAYLEASAPFHRAVASMSGNPLLDLYSVSLEDIFLEHVGEALSPPEKREHVLEVHRAIADAIASGDADVAERTMRDHMQEYANWVRDRHPELMPRVINWWQVG